MLNGARRTRTSARRLPGGRWLVGLVLVAPLHGARAQATDVARLWRELEGVRRLWRVERQVLVEDLDRFRAQRARRRFGRSEGGKSK